MPPGGTGEGDQGVLGVAHAAARAYSKQRRPVLHLRVGMLGLRDSRAPALPIPPGQRRGPAVSHGSSWRRRKAAASRRPASACNSSNRPLAAASAVNRSLSTTVALPRAITRTSQFARPARDTSTV